MNYILDTSPAQALEQAGIPRSQWNAIDMTGDLEAKGRLTGQLQRNGLTSQGTTTVMMIITSSKAKKHSIA